MLEMKRILTLLLGGLLMSTTVNTVISCKSNIIPTDSNDDLNYQGDLKILNGITKHISDVFSQYADEKKLILIIIQFRNLKIYFQ